MQSPAEPINGASITRCRMCKGDHFGDVISLGPHALGGVFPRTHRAGIRCRLPSLSSAARVAASRS